MYLSHTNEKTEICQTCALTLTSLLTVLCLLGRGGGRVTRHLRAHPAGVLAGVVQRAYGRGGQHRGKGQECLRWGDRRRGQSEEVIPDLQMLTSICKILMLILCLPELEAA